MRNRQYSTIRKLPTPADCGNSI